MNLSSLVVRLVKGLLFLVHWIVGAGLPTEGQSKRTVSEYLSNITGSEGTLRRSIWGATVGAEEENTLPVQQWHDSIRLRINAMDSGAMPYYYMKELLF